MSATALAIVKALADDDFRDDGDDGFLVTAPAEVREAGDGLVGSRDGQFVAVEVVTSAVRLALAALSCRFQEAAVDVLAPVACRAVEVMTERVGRGSQVAAVAALLDRAGLGAGAGERRRVAVGVVDSVTAARGVRGG